MENYKSGTVNSETHPIMHTPPMAEKFDVNCHVEVTKIASVAQMYQCLANACGGDETGKGCRFIPNLLLHSKFGINLHPLPVSVLAIVTINSK
jgi:hypothetical protein